jgi:hypothetical protein
MLQQCSLNKIIGLVKNVKVFVKSVVYLLSSYLLINVPEELVQSDLVLTLLMLSNAKIRAYYKAFCCITSTPNQLRTL